MALVKESVTDRHQFHAGSDGIRGPGLVGLKTRWTCPVKIRELITMTQFTLRVSVDTGLMAYITDLVERAMAPMALVTQQSVMDPIDSCPE
jgi:hypothetical protein